ncbi:hypothetical protein GBA52_010723 [Prunus armeniaca]|nr:hypothetical protein GBA52_010723 [Prunus armeniaca]
MLVFSWNVRGLGNRRTFRDLKSFLQDKRPDVIFLSETRMTAVHMGKLHTRLGFGGVVCVPRVGFSGGLCLLWRVGLQVVLLSSSPGHIDVRVTMNTSATFRVTGFYGHPDQTQRHHSWELLRRLGRVDLGPWLCCGDFNESHHEFHVLSDGPHGDKARGPRVRRRFQFEEVWTKEVDCEEVVRHSWQNAVSPLSNIDNCASNLSRWSAEKGGQVPKKVKELRLRLASLQSDEPSTQTFHTRSLIETEIDKCLEQEEIYWHQRSRVHWLQHGDRNTSFFHKQATSRRKKNALVGILDENDRWQREYDKIGGVFVEFFTNLFTSDMGVADVEKYWSIVGPEVSDLCLRVLNGSDGVNDFNHTLVALIPKVHSPTRVSEYRPISLCNVLYKIISKTLANRLKKVLPEVISEFQSAFIPNRMILDNVLAAFETKLKLFLSIPLMGDTLDRRIWNFTKNGRYSVKSGYWAALEYKRLEVSAGTVAGPSSSSLKSWKHLWKLKVPQKILHLLWRVAQDILPSKEVLFRRRITQGEVWEALDFPRDFLLPTVADVGTWMDAAWSVIPPDKQSLFAFTVWVLWNERNGVLFGSQPTPSGVLVQRAKDYDAEFKRYSAANHRSLSSPVRDIKWRPPTGNCFKLNVDGATDMETGARGAGAIVRDSHGNLVGALAMRAPSRISVLATELYALKFLWSTVRRNALLLREVWWMECDAFWSGPRLLLFDMFLAKRTRLPIALPASVCAIKELGYCLVPYALSSGGWLSLIPLFVIAAAAFYSGLLIQRCMDEDSTIRTYPDIGEHAFGKKGRIPVT